LLRHVASIVVVLLLTSCATAQETSDVNTSPHAIQYGLARRIARFADKRINESSGIARSIANPGMFWTHNDSGDVPRLFLFDREGKTRATLVIEGAEAEDWEDMASFEREGRGYLLIGDFGDNRARRDRCTLYLVPEPKIKVGGEAVVVKAGPSVTIPFVYEDGPRDCEALAVDPANGTIYLISKTRDANCTVYSLPWPAGEAGTVLTARSAAKQKIAKTTAMDISPDGSRAIVLTYGEAYEFVRGESETWSEAFARKGRFVAMPGRKQGEAICYGADGITLYLTSEGEFRPLWEKPPVSN